MPLLNIVSNRDFSSVEKQIISKVMTNLVIETWKVLPDKIQVQVLSVKNDELYRGGVAPINDEFTKKSRMTLLNSDEYYEVPSSNSAIEELLTVSIDTWTGFSFADKTNLVSKLTKYFVDEYKFSGDNVLVYIRDILPENWFQNGVSGRNPEFLNKSREVKY